MTLPNNKTKAGLTMGFFSRFRKKSLQQPVDNGRGWRSIIHEPYTGAWQRNDEICESDMRSFFAIYSCITLIAGDISKLKARVRRLLAIRLEL